MISGSSSSKTNYYKMPPRAMDGGQIINSSGAWPLQSRKRPRTEGTQRREVKKQSQTERPLGARSLTPPSTRRPALPAQPHFLLGAHYPPSLRLCRGAAAPRNKSSVNAAVPLKAKKKQKEFIINKSGKLIREFPELQGCI